jgi:Mg2+/Co2+ transporter CorB
VILIGNNLVNISASALLTVLIIRRFGDQYVWIGTLILTLFIIIFAEIAPKNFAAKKPEAVAYPASRPLEVLTNILGWFSKILTNFSNSLTGTKSEENYFSKGLNREELRSVLDEDTEEVDKDEMNALKSLLELRDLSVEDILIPINEVKSIKLMEDYVKNEIESDILLPVYRNNEEIIGFLDSANIDKLSKDNDNIEDFLIPPYFVPESTQLFSQLKKFQKNGSQAAMVVDEYGSITGMVFLEDLIEQIVGRLKQEDDGDGIVMNDDFSVLVEGSMSVRELNKFMSWNMPEGKAKTLSGLIVEHLDEIPKGDVCIVLDSYKIETTKIDKNIIKQVKVSRV